jgi:hypothetical protein
MRTSQIARNFLGLSLETLFGSYFPAILRLFQVQSESRALVKCTKGPESRIKVVSFYLFIVFRSNVCLNFSKKQSQSRVK